MGITEGPVIPDLGATTDPWLSVLSSALDGSPPVDPLALVKAQLEAQGDERARLLLRILERQQQQREASAREWAAETAAPIDGDGQEGGEATTDGADDPLTDVQNVQQAVDALYAEVEVLRERTAAMATATGACARCFGENPLCDRCLGRGVPGWRRPDPIAFKRYVLPAYRRARAIERARAGRPIPRSDVHAHSAHTTTAGDER